MRHHQSDKKESKSEMVEKALAAVRTPGEPSTKRSRRKSQEDISEKDEFK